MRHRISDVDEQERTGRCSQCGPVEVYPNTGYKGKRYWRCSVYQRTYQNRKVREFPDLTREARFLRLYGITVEEYDRLLEAQGGTCARCKKPPSETLRLAVDHCHTTGRVRGLLCGPCNTYLGRLEANLSQLLEDLAYIGTDAAPIKERLAEQPARAW